jgi:hypothetical protein
MPSLSAGVSYLILLSLLGCGSFRIPFKKKKANSLAGAYQEMSTKDYSDHLASIKNFFLNTPGIKTVKIDQKQKRYFSDVTQDIIGSNEIFFKDLKSAEVTILDIESPLHLSLPRGEIFLSRGLIAKYLKHESMLVSILAYELARSEKLLYPKETMIPVGFVPIERMISLNRLNIEEKMEIHKWAYHLATRSGYDGEYYLAWLQIQNRNTADFVMQVGDVNQMNREEALFKAFMIKHPVEDLSISKKNSSKGFYALLNRIRDGVL